MSEDEARLARENLELKAQNERLHEALEGLVADVEDYGEPRRHRAALAIARNLLMEAAGEIPSRRLGDHIHKTADEVASWPDWMRPHRD